MVYPSKRGSVKLKKEINEGKLRGMLTEKERLLYEKILEDISENEDFYSRSNAEEITFHLVKECGYDMKEIYSLFKKIAKISEE